MMTNKDSSDFHYLLSLMPPMCEEPEFSFLPEMFSIIGHERLVTLCRYAGGETIKIPTLEQLSSCIDALQWYYDTEIQNKVPATEMPEDIRPLVDKIKKVYKSARYRQTNNS